MLLSEKQKIITDRARKTYGTRNQLAVAAEECNELAIAVLKFMRYSDEERGLEKTRESVLEERADIEIILDHIDAIYKFDPDEIKEVISRKAERLEKWLNKTSDIEYTTVYRELSPKDTCVNCYYNKHFEEAIRTKTCYTCENGSNKIETTE